MAKWVYLFSEGNANMRNLLGGKGANLAEMTNLGMPVPQGFTVTTEACTDYYNNGKKISRRFRDRSLTLWLNWRRSRERPLAILRIRFWFPFVPVREHPCRV